MKRFRATIHYVNFNIINFASELVPNEPSCFLWYTFIKYDFRSELGIFLKGSSPRLCSEIVRLGLGLSCTLKLASTTSPPLLDKLGSGTYAQTLTRPI